MIGFLRIALAVLVIITFTVLMMPAQIAALKRGWDLRKRIPIWWHRLAARLLGMRIHTKGEMVRDRPLLIAANHISWSDIVAFGAVADVSFIAKSEMSDWPVFGWLAKLQNSVFVERENRRKSAKQANEIADRLAAHDAMVLFAEGTTADGNYMLPFKTSLFGAAQIALRSSGIESVTVQPVSIAYTKVHGLPMGRTHRHLASWIGDEDLLPHLGQFLREGAIDVEITFGEPEPFRRDGDRKRIGRLMEERVSEMLARSLNGGTHVRRPHESESESKIDRSNSPVE